MPQKVRIALDAMGGDHGPSVIVPGAEIALDRHPDLEFLLYGDTALINPLLSARVKLAAVSRAFHT
ncbi:MAG: phosphate acyltransferase, partial [Xanthobacteraceae bacterium]|nr:phosphate acyltransferase [Xanthobacteraceae bacterium]